MWKNFVDYLIFDAFGMQRGDSIAEAVNFFVYDGIKILTMLVVIIFFVTYIRTFFNAEKVRGYLAKKHPLIGHFAAAIFGIVTPFCSCSAVPLFLGFMQARIPIGVAFSFLISAPMNNEIAIGLLFALFGFKVAALYIVFGLLVAVIGGWVIGRLGAQKWLLVNTTWMSAKPSCSSSASLSSSTLKSRAIYSREYTFEIVKKVWAWVLLGVGVGAFIHGFVPADFVASIAGRDNIFAVPLAVLSGIPVYANCAGAMPLILPLIDKGMSLGTALAFMMSVTALSLPEAIILKKILHTKLIAIFFGIVGLGIICVGYIFNWILQ